jgi:rhamnosyltransferase subunit B
MAKVVVYTMAYRGDVFPFVPIASELSRRGHDVTFVGPEELRGQLASEPFAFRDGDCGDLTPSGLDSHGDYVRRWGRVLSGGMLLRLYFGELVIPRLPQLYAAIADALDGADLLVSHPAASLVGRMACEKRGTPWVVGDLFPMLTPTQTRAPAMLRIPPPNGPVSRAIVNAAWRFGRTQIARWLSSEQGFATFRASLGLETEKGHAVYGRLSPHHNVVLVSPQYFPPANDWPDTYRVTGFVHWTASNDEIPDEVEAFLAAGDPPVVVSLGTSAAGADPAVFGRVRATLDRLGLRGLYLTSTSELGAGLPEGAVWPYVPLQPLMSRCRAIVHSGAHGTNALALAAGLPSVVLPQLFDQVWHGRRQHELGTGVVLGRRRDVASIETALRSALDDQHVTAARDFARLLATENGLQAACDEIESFLARSSA